MSASATTIPEDYPDCLIAISVHGAAALSLDALRAVDGSLPEHSHTGPSSADRIFRCPGSLRLARWIESQPEQEADSTADSERGTALHALAAKILEFGDIACSLPRADLSDDDAEAVDIAVGHVESLRAELDDPTAIELYEDRVDISDCGAGWGTIDWARLIPGNWGIVGDLKFGARAVSHPRHNWQAILYGHGLCRAFGLQWVRLAIIRPSADEEWQLMVWDASAEQLAELARAYREAVFAAERPDAPFVVGEKQCEWCPGKRRNVCPARWACAAQVPRHGSWRARIQTASPSELRDLYERAGIAAQMFGALRAAIAEEAIAQPLAVKIQGYEVRASNGRREWIDPAKAGPALEQIAAAKGKDPAALYEPRSLVSPAAAEKVVGKSAEVVNRLAPFITKTPGKPGLHKES